MFPPTAGSDAGGQQQQQQRTPPVPNEAEAPAVAATGISSSSSANTDSNSANAVDLFREHSGSVGDMPHRFRDLSVGDAASHYAARSLRPAATSAGCGDVSHDGARDNAHLTYNENTRPTGWSTNPGAAGASSASTQGFRSHAGPLVDEYRHLRSAGPAEVAPLSISRKHAVGMNLGDAPGSVGSSGGEGWGRGGELEDWRRLLGIGSELDVKDTVDKWCEASVVNINEVTGEVKVTYKYWSQKVRGELERESARQANLNSGRFDTKRTTKLVRPGIVKKKHNPE